jgi:hypothetical protein
MFELDYVTEKFLVAIHAPRGEGSVGATLKRVSDQEAARVIDLILNVYHRVETYRRGEVSNDNHLRCDR